MYSCQGTNLIIAGDEEGGSGNAYIWIMSASMSRTMVISLGGSGVSVSSACGTHPSRCRRLTVNSTQLDNYHSRHTVFIPLQNGLHLLELIYNGSMLPSGQNLFVSKKENVFFGHGVATTDCPINCVSLGVYKVGVLFYSVCVAHDVDEVCTCEISQNFLDSHYSFRSCYPYPIDVRPNFESISDIVSIPEQFLLLFFVGNTLFQIKPVQGSMQLLNTIHACTSVNHVRPESARNLLFVYCDYNTTVVYSLDDDLVVMVLEEQLLFPCSAGTNISVDLPLPNRTPNIQHRTGNAVTHNFLPGGADIVFGTCIMYKGNDLFVYSDRSDGIYVYNASKLDDNFSLVWRRTQPCLLRQCGQPHIFGNRYTVSIDNEQRAVFMHDIENFSAVPLVTILRTSAQLVTVIEALQYKSPQTPEAITTGMHIHVHIATTV